MRARHAEIVTSAATPAAFPPESDPEIAFTGRSNVGKSSLINALTGFRGLARTSSTPGRTQLLNWFAVTPPVGPPLRFVDFPGYGYAKVPRARRASFAPLVDAYLEQRNVLRLVVVIIDIRRAVEPQEDETLFLEWLAQRGRRAQVVLTKVDKLSKSKRIPAAAAARRALGLAHAPILFSAIDGDGVRELWDAVLRPV